MDGMNAVEYIAQCCGQAFVNALDIAILEKKRASEVISLVLQNPETGKRNSIKVTIVTEPQVFTETEYGKEESSVTHGMKLLERNNETTIPEHLLI